MTETRKMIEDCDRWKKPTNRSAGRRESSVTNVLTREQS